MKILLISAYFPPDNGSASHLFYELGTELVERGHEVTVITGMPGYHAQGMLEKYKRRLTVIETVNGMRVKRVSILQLPRRIMFGRAIWQFSGALTFLMSALSLPKQEIAMVYSPPLPLGLTAWSLKTFRRIPFILNVQDLFPQSIIDLGLLKNKFIIRLFKGMERFTYKHADSITVHSNGNFNHVMSMSTKPEKISVIPNWVDTDFIKPSERMNGFRKLHDLADDFIVSFAGVLGYSQDIDVIIEAARLIEERKLRIKETKIKWVIVGDGVEKERLEAKTKNIGIDNIKFLPMQPRDKYPDILHASDVCLVTLKKKVKTPVVPSKILSIMAAGRPVVGALNMEGDAPRLIEDSQCGISIPPEDPEALAEAVLRLFYNAELRERYGKNGRLYAEQHLSLKTCVQSYENLLGSLSKNS